MFCEFCPNSPAPEWPPASVVGTKTAIPLSPRHPQPSNDGLYLEGNQMIEGDNFTANVADLLGLQAARLTNVEGNSPVALLTFRFEPSESYAMKNIALTQSQCIRLRDDLNILLTSEGSWLFTEDAFEVREEDPFEIDFPSQS